MIISNSLQFFFFFFYHGSFFTNNYKKKHVMVSVPSSPLDFQDTVLHSFLSKVLTKLAHDQTVHYLSSNGLLKCFQTSFRISHRARKWFSSNLQTTLEKSHDAVQI